MSKYFYSIKHTKQLLLLCSFCIALSACGKFDFLPNSEFSAEDNAQPTTSSTDAIVITQQPQSVSLVSGDGFSLSVTVEGDDTFEYQWQKGGSIIPGATKRIYAVGSGSQADEGSYRVTVRKGSDEVTSEFANVIVTDAIGPVSITAQPQSAIVSMGATASFQVEASGGGFISYQWQKDGSAINNAYTNTLNIIQSNLSDAGTYSVVVTNSQGSLTSDSATLTVLPDEAPVSIDLQPQSVTVLEGENTLINVSASGGGTLSYQWHLNGNNISGATQSSYAINGASLSDGGTYTVTVQNSNSSETSLAALVTVNLNIPSTSSISLTWDIPTLREDGSTLELYEITGYLIEYGPVQGNLTGRVSISDGANTQYTLSDQSAGTLYLRIATVDSDGLQGNFSGLLSVSIP